MTVIVCECDHDVHCNNHFSRWT